MARLRAVVVIQPPGFGGTPWIGHCSAAMAKASATASSARSMSPRTRMRVAVQRPISRRKMSASASGTFGGPDFDRSFARRGGFAGPVQSGIEVCRFDDPEAAHLLFGLGVGSVGHRDVASGRGSNNGCAGGRAEAGAEHPRARLLHRSVDLVHLCPDALHLR